VGIEARPVDVEVDVYPSGTERDFIVVGMPDTAVKESRQRIRSALYNSGFYHPSQTVTINLAPTLDDVRFAELRRQQNTKSAYGVAAARRVRGV
jgi:hypothetical protein